MGGNFVPSKPWLIKHYVKNLSEVIPTVTPFDAKAWCATHATMPNGAFCTSIYAGLDKDLATALLPILNGTVGDFGAGGGWYSSFFQNRSIESIPYDASPTRPASVRFADLSTPLEASVPVYDWVLCLEVGEHLSTDFENIFIDNVAGHATFGIVMSWAVPGQGGNGHVNERPNDWVIEQLRSRAFTYDKEASEMLREKATFNWFKDTLMVFRSGRINEAPKKSTGPYRILVTGGAGFIGMHTSLRLRKDGHHVVAYDNLNSYYSPALKEARVALLLDRDIFFAHADVCNTTALASILGEHAIDRVIHLAAQAGVRHSLDHPHEYTKNNVDCFVALLETLKGRDVRLVYASSSSVYGLNDKIPFSEHDPVDKPASLYAATKRMNELTAYVYHNLYGQPSVGLRFFTVYGPWGRPDMAYY
jgi:hypothetical protein